MCYFVQVQAILKLFQIFDEIFGLVTIVLRNILALNGWLKSYASLCVCVCLFVCVAIEIFVIV